MKNNYSEKANECFNNKEFDKALELYEKAIENKEYDACSIIGMMYLMGYGTEQNTDKGLDYLFLGDKHDDAKSISALADYYYTGKYLNQDLDKAKSYYNRASILLEPHAMGMLGLFLFNEEKYDEAVEYFKSGTMYYDTNSMYYLAKCSYNGLGMEKDDVLAFEIYKKLYEFDNTNKEITKYLADMYFNGYGTNQNIEKAKELYEKLDDDESIFNLGLIYKNYLKEYDKALELFKKVKNERSQFEQALMLYNGLGMPENKNDAYFKFFACAMSKYVYSYPFVGDCYYYGYGVKQNYNDALKWYNEALEAGIKNQCLNIAMVYIKLKKYDEALKYLNEEEDSVNKYLALGEVYKKQKKYSQSYNSFLSAAELNDPNACFIVYKMLKKGKGTEKNKIEALKYYQRFIILSNQNDSENT